MVEEGKTWSNGDEIPSKHTVKEVFGDMEETGRPKIIVTTLEMLEDYEHSLVEAMKQALEITMADRKERNEDEK